MKLIHLSSDSVLLPSSFDSQRALVHTHRMGSIPVVVDQLLVTVTKNQLRAFIHGYVLLISIQSGNNSWYVCGSACAREQDVYFIDVASSKVSTNHIKFLGLLGPF